MYQNVLQVFHYVQQCFTLFSESRNDWNCRIGDRAAADRLRDHDNVAGIGNNSAEIGDNAAEIGDDTAGIVDITAKVILC